MDFYLLSLYRFWQYAVLVTLVLVPVVYGYARGIPEDSNHCRTLLPAHGAHKPSTTPPPFKLVIYKRKYKAGKTINMNIIGDFDFKGFAVQVRPYGNRGLSGDMQYGTFKNYPSYARGACFNTTSLVLTTLTQTSNVTKRKLEFVWVAPKQLQYPSCDDCLPNLNLQVWVTFVKDFTTFWLYRDKTLIRYAGPKPPTVAPPPATTTTATTTTTPTTTPTTSTLTPTTSYLTTRIKAIDTGGCGKNKNCFRHPANCPVSSCKFLTTWRTVGQYVDFELSGTLTDNARYMAVGFSTHGRMSTSPVVNCVYDERRGTVFVQSAENIQAPGNRVLQPSRLGLDIVKSEGSYSNGSLTCRFSYIKSSSLVTYNTADVASLADFVSTKYHLIFAKGRVQSGTIGYHGTAGKVVSDKKFKFADCDFIDVGNGGKSSIHAHGCLMIIAWMIFAGLGILIPRYYKPMWPHVYVCGKQLWFILHLVCVTTAISLSLVAFLVIFAHARSNTSQMNTLSQRIHSFLGITIIGLSIIQPILALFRCSEESKHRVIFTWIHRIIGQIVFFGAAGNILIATYTSRTIADHRGSSALVLGFIGLHVITEAILIVIKINEHVYNKHKVKPIELITVSSKIGHNNTTNVDFKLLEDEYTSRCLEKTILGIYAIGAVGLASGLMTKLVAP